MDTSVEHRAKKIVILIEPCTMAVCHSHSPPSPSGIHTLSILFYFIHLLTYMYAVNVDPGTDRCMVRESGSSRLFFSKNRVSKNKDK